MKKIFYVLAILFFINSIAFSVTTPTFGNASKTLTLETRFLGFAFQPGNAPVAQIRFYYNASPKTNSGQSSPLIFSRAKFKFRGKYYNLTFQYRRQNLIEADVVEPTNEELVVPIGHLSLRVIKNQLLAGSLKIFPENGGRKDKNGSGEFNIYLNVVPGPALWSDLKKKEADDKKWAK